MRIRVTINAYVIDLDEELFEEDGEDNKLDMRDEKVARDRDLSPTQQRSGSKKKNTRGTQHNWNGMVTAEFIPEHLSMRLDHKKKNHMTLSTSSMRDSNGDMLQMGTNYYVQPIFPDEAWGFELASISNDIDKPCPLGIVQEDYYPGTPLLFSHANSEKGAIRLSTDLNIDYNLSYTVCTKSKDVIWTVGPYDRRAQSYFLVLGGVKGKPGRKTIRNWFKIEVFGDNYKIRYCPSVCWNCKVACKDVGVIEYNGQKRLGLSDFPVEVKFVKDA
ncbi:hypothetical protein BC332_32639 [Capsicum chinense]|nr:hypothetical protein BC332_32639 [Capsicum chinense]